MASEESSILEKHLRRWIGWIAWIFALQVAMVPVLFVYDYGWGDAGDYFVRFIICLGLVIWGFGYYVLDKTVWKMAFGVGQIVLGLAIDWYQLGKIGAPINFADLWRSVPATGADQSFDKTVFFVAGVAAIAHGWKDLLDGSIRFEKIMRQWREDRKANYVAGPRLRYILLSIPRSSEPMPQSTESSATAIPAQPSHSTK